LPIWEFHEDLKTNRHNQCYTLRLKISLFVWSFRWLSKPETKLFSKILKLFFNWFPKQIFGVQIRLPKREESEPHSRSAYICPWFRRPTWTSPAFPVPLPFPGLRRPVFVLDLDGGLGPASRWVSDRWWRSKSTIRRPRGRSSRSSSHFVWKKNRKKLLCWSHSSLLWLKKIRLLSCFFIL